ncbi:hypothetical protein GCM10007291_20920 [Gemmobacter nanjingensis]|uniref:Uncharacterized protein n=1 Tax=Gemmobacter nanjingensis TaxID=488454 RepID=A0ABQ3FF75_9RHOB|nr:hypothetical protein GCM10007291_20920 [Gemmobacter nanjingensis]
MGIQRGRLLADRLDHARVAMADMGDVVIAIEVFAPPGIPHPDALAPDDMYRIVIEGRNIRPEKGTAAGNKVGHGMGFRRQVRARGH